MYNLVQGDCLDVMLNIPDRSIDLILTVNLPDNFTSLGHIFTNCYSLQTITIPSKVTSLESTFNGCKGLTTINLPSGITNIGDYTFFDCTSLTTINFAGTVAQWNAITFGGDNWKTNVPATYVQCSDGIVNL